VAGKGSFGVNFEHMFTSVNGVANGGASASIPARRDSAAETFAGSVTFCDMV
jgi:hypothetical protein